MSVKTKDNVKKTMSALKKTAPEIYAAMVAERDIYMAKGLDELGRNLSNELCRQTVAVVGNVGIETYLASARWKEVVCHCPVKRY